MIDRNTKLLGLIGYPLEHSLSPILHNKALQQQKLNYLYLPLEVEAKLLPELMKLLKEYNFRGANVTIPYKERVIKYLDGTDDLVKATGAVNTIVREKNRLIGYNTDVYGFIRMLEEEGGFKIKGSKVVIIGAGGAARAVVTALYQGGCRDINIVNRTLSRGKELVREVRKTFSSLQIKSYPLERDFYYPLIFKADLVVNTTPIGMYPHSQDEPVIDVDVLHDNLLVVDLIYNPRKTKFLQAARKAGAETLNGEMMLLYQAFKAYKLWTGIEPDLGLWCGLMSKYIKSTNH